MTHLEHWQYYNKDIPTPAPWIDWGYYFIISAALQRRVWFSGGPWALYPNIYLTLVGPPGVGKGMILKPVKEVLTHYKLDPLRKALKAAKDIKMMESVDAQEFTDTIVGSIVDGTAGFAKKKPEEKEEKLLFPIAADATSYEALVRSMAKCTQWSDYKEQMPDGNTRLRKYFHCSMFFALEEISSLFEKHAQKIQDFLLVAYDCGDKYRRETITRDVEIIKRPCLSFIGGTVPDFVKEVFDNRLLSSGFASRTFFLWGEESRFKKLLIPAPDSSQMASLDLILKHVKAISELYGALSFAPGVFEKLESWWETEDTTVNKNPRLQYYYSRKNIHTLKLAIIMHFCDKTNMVIDEEDANKAIAVLAKAEENMHLALRIGERNPLANTSRLVLAYIRKELFVTREELLAKFWDELEGFELDKILDFLTTTKVVGIKAGKNGRGSGYIPSITKSNLSIEEEYEFSNSMKSSTFVTGKEMKIQSS